MNTLPKHLSQIPEDFPSTALDRRTIDDFMKALKCENEEQFKSLIRTLYNILFDISCD